MPEARVDWNDDRVEQLKTLWREGLSCSAIASSIGAGATRSAVIGKVHRLGLAGRADPHRERSVQAGPARAAKPRPPAPKPDVSSANPPFVLETGAFVTLETVSDHTCRWPIGDPQSLDFHFCGNAPRAGAPYCEGHCRDAYQPLTNRAIREDDGRRANGRHHHMIRRSQPTMWE